MAVRGSVHGGSVDNFYAPIVKAFRMSADQADLSHSPTSSTANTGRTQSTGLGPSTHDPRDWDATDPTQRPNPFIEVGATGLVQYGGFVREEFLPQLQGDRWLRVAREMYDNDAIIGALVFAIQMLLRKVEWRVEPPESPTVEGIVAARQKKRMQMVAEKRRQENIQLALQGNQAGQPLAPGGPPGSTGSTQRSGFASPVGSQPTPFHKPLPANPTNPTNSTSSPSTPPSRSSTPDSQPGPNAQPNPATRPSTNFPARPNSPSSNPGGGPNQSGALTGSDGLPGARPQSRASAVDPGSDTETGGLLKKPLPNPMQKVFEDWYDERVEKASASGQFVGGIESLDVGTVPLDPETGEPMEFPVGDDPLAPPSPQEQHAMELAVLVETAFHDMADPFADFISQVITMIVFGFALHEIVYKKRNGPNPDDPVQGSRYADGRIGWAKLAGRAQETRHRWEFDENGNVLGMWQLAPPKFQLKYIPMSKALLFRTTGYKGNPEGRSILRSAFRSWQLKRRIEEIEAIGIERDLAGLPVAHVPYQWMSPWASPEEQAALAEIKKIVRNVRQDEQSGLVFPTIVDFETKQELFKFELLGSSSRRSFDTDKVIARYDQRIAMVALVDFILLGHESTGSKALADVKADLFTSALEAWLDSIADVLNTYAIPRLMQINGEDPAMSPRITFGKLTRISLTEMATLITAMAGAGADIFPSQTLEDYLLEAGGMPPKEATDDI